MLFDSSQHSVFEKIPEDERLVVVSTNISELSLTAPGIKYVVDTGKEIVAKYNHDKGILSYAVKWISRLSANRRSQRAGRDEHTILGQCHRLYSSKAFSKDNIFSELSCPEISRVAIDRVVLLIKSLDIEDKVEFFLFPTPPSAAALEEAEICLKAIEAVDEKGKITSLGRAMALYPFCARFSRVILRVLENQGGFAQRNLKLGYAAAIVAALISQDPLHDRERAKDARGKLKRMQIKTMLNESPPPRSEILIVSYALHLFDLAEDKLEFCTKNSLCLKAMEMMGRQREAIIGLIFYQQCKAISWDYGRLKDVKDAWLANCNKHPLQMKEEQILAEAICSGWPDRIAKRMSRKVHKEARAIPYQSCAMDDIIYLHVRSPISRGAPDFVVYNELLCNKGRICME